MRLEKGYLHWKADLLTEFDPYETGLNRFVKMDKGDFIGREALRARAANAPSKTLRTLILDTDQAAAHGGASVELEGEVVGTVTSGDFGHRVDANIALAFVDAAVPPSAAVVVDVIGMKVPARFATGSLYDPEGSRFRA